MRNLGLADLAFLGAVSGGAPWTPAAVATALWFDAADSGTVATTSGAVSQWNDKSGFSRNLTQGNSSQRPLYLDNQLSAKPAVVFDGSNDILLTAEAGALGVNNVSFFCLMRYDSTSAEDLPFGIGRTGSAGTVRAFYRTSSGTTQGFATWSNDIVSSSVPVDIAGSYHIFEVIQNGSSIFLLRNGVADTVFPRSLGSAPNPVSFGGASIGSLQGDGSGSYYANVAVAEIIAFYTAVNTSTRQLVEGYLAHKWGLTANLPSDHPYKSAAPTL